VFRDFLFFITIKISPNGFNKFKLIFK